MKDYCHPINPAEKGPASMEGTSEFTIPQLLHRCAETMGDKPALRVEREKETGVCPGAAAFAAKELTQKTANVKGTFPPQPRFPAMEWGNRDGKADDQWTTWTYRQYYEESAAIAKALMAAKVEQFDAVAIFGFNSPEWVMASQATFMAGAKTAGIYPTDTAEQIAYKWCVPLAAPFLRVRPGTEPNVCSQQPLRLKGDCAGGQALPQQVRHCRRQCQGRPDHRDLEPGR